MRELEDAGARRITATLWRCIDFGGADFRQWREHDTGREHDEDGRHREIGQVDLRGKLVEQHGPCCRIGSRDLRGKIADPVQYERADHEWREHAGDLVADAHHGDALRRAVDRSEDADVGIRGGLQDGKAGTDHEQATERAGIPALRRELAEYRSADRHDQQAERDAFLHAGCLENGRGGQGEQEI